MPDDARQADAAMRPAETCPANRPRGASDIFATVPFALKRHISPHGQVTAVSMMKDEGPFVIEWVAHHLALGFSDLVVYTNDCSDGTDDMLIRLEELGLVHHRRNDIPEGQRPQPSALNYAQEEPVVCQSDWVMVFDADEFLSIRYGDGTLDDLIAAAVAQDANGVVITWRIFGSNGVTDWARTPVSEQYLRAAPQEWNKGWGVKTLFKFAPEFWKLGIHRPKLKSKWIKTEFPDQVKWLNGSGVEMPDYFKFRGWRSIVRTVGYDWVQLNHYAVKSVDSYAIRKLRGNVNNKKDKYNSDYWSLQDRNEVLDETMLRYTARRNELITALLADPVMAKLHQAALERVETRLAELRQTEAYHELRSSLAAASRVPLNQIVAKPPQARDPEKIAALMSEIERDRNAAAKDKRLSLPREPAASIPLGTFARPITPNPDFAGDWVDNHGLALPLDPGIFSPAGLKLVSKGKFERGLARRLPQILPQDGVVLEIGAALGFHAAQLAKLRKDLTLVIQEEDAGLRSACAQIFGHSGLSFDAQLQHDTTELGQAPVTGLRAMLSRLRPQSLLIADPAVTPEVLSEALFSHRPEQLLIYGRTLEENRSRADAYEQLAQSAGLQPISGFDANLTLFFSRRHADLAAHAKALAAQAAAVGAAAASAED